MKTWFNERVKPVGTKREWLRLFEPRRAKRSTRPARPQDCLQLSHFQLMEGCQDRVELKLSENGMPLRVSSEGFNAPYHCTRRDGTDGVFKPIPKDDKRWSVQSWLYEMAKEVVASRILRAFSRESGVIYRTASNQQLGLLGVSTRLLDITTLHAHPERLRSISNPDQAIAAGVVDCWMGNYDRIEKNSNVWISNKTNSVVYGDYGCAFYPGVKVLGLPKVNADLFQAYATRDRVEPTLTKIRGLSDASIGALVDECARGCNFLRSEVRDEMVKILIQNRDELRKENPFAGYYNQGRPKGQISTELVEGLTERLGSPDDVTQNIRGDVVQGQQDVRRIAGQMGVALAAAQGGVFGPIPVEARDLIAWRELIRNRLSPEEMRKHHLGFIAS